jgi:hypothetical protein
MLLYDELAKNIREHTRLEDGADRVIRATITILTDAMDAHSHGEQISLDDIKGKIQSTAEREFNKRDPNG